MVTDTPDSSQMRALAGQYFAPKGLYEYTKSLPFLGTLKCETTSLTAGQWTELVVEYTVGASGLADGAWIKGTFKFYSDWALFQTADRTRDNYVSAEYLPGPLCEGQTPATVQSLAVRFDQKGHERPFQKAVIVDVVDGFMNPGDRIVVRMGDRRWGARGTRVQTFVEDRFPMRWYIDPIGTSRFAPITPDLGISIRPGAVAAVKAITPRVLRPGVEVPIHVHTQDAWGNATADQKGLSVHLAIQGPDAAPEWQTQLPFPKNGWTVTSTATTLPVEGDYTLVVRVFPAPSSSSTTTGSSIASAAATTPLCSATYPLTAHASLPVPRPYFADLHVHSDDTVGTNDTSYNFSYARLIAGLDVVGYTANDFNVTSSAWVATCALIRSVNADPDHSGRFLVFPGTEWCGNSCAGGDRNVVFLEGDVPYDFSDEKNDNGNLNIPETARIEFPHLRTGLPARSFEWNEHGPSTLAPGRWPLDEVYAAYAHSPERVLMIPHVGGRRCDLAWHHPGLERLLEIGSAWGLFEWLLRDSVARGWRLGVSANSDEHRGRCGGGVPGTAVFGTKGGLTGVLVGGDGNIGTSGLERGNVAKALRARRTFATTGERLVGVVSAEVSGRRYLQGDDVILKTGENLEVKYDFFGQGGFSTVEAWNRKGMVMRRDMQCEAEEEAQKRGGSIIRKLRVKWGGARLYDRYREAVWDGSILVSGATVTAVRPFGGVTDNPQDSVSAQSDTQVVFSTRTSGDFDGVDIFVESTSMDAIRMGVTGSIGGYVKVGNPLAGKPHSPQPEFSLQASVGEMEKVGGKKIDIAGGADLFLSAECLVDVPLPTSVCGQFLVSGQDRSAGDEDAIYFVGREWSGGKVITSPLFLDYA